MGRALVPQQSLDPIRRTSFSQTLVRFVITKNFSTILLFLRKEKFLFITQSMIGFISDNNIVSENK